MEWLTNEVLFYGGMAAAICSVTAMVIYSGIAYVRWMQLGIRLDEEYGKKKSVKSNSHRKQ